MSDLHGRLTFIREAERLKNTLRSAHTSTGRTESTAEHTWRLCLLAMTFEDLLGPLDFERVLKLCIVHDLGEAINGDVPAISQTQEQDKSGRERRDLIELSKSAPPALQAELLALWDEYEHMATREAQIVKALDKIETIIQHNQGANPPDFDYLFNLEYGKRYAGAHPIITELRALVDAETQSNADRSAQVKPAGAA
ncbi:MAG: hypothetical protein RL341_2301 [Pseudomonadota bacterium]|jgi:putative hydrolase of HD superfamily